MRLNLNYFTKALSTVGRWVATGLFCAAAIAFVWQGAAFSTSAAMAAPMNNLIAASDVGNQVQNKTREDASRAKGFIRDTADKVERTANKNADRVDRADDRGGFFERKAQSDRATIHKRAEEDAARTEKAVDNTKNAIERAVDGIKDALN